MSRLFQSHLGGEITDNPLTSGATTLNSAALAAMQAVASPDHMIICLDPDGINGAPEYVKVTAHTASATSATISRGALGSTAREHRQGLEWVHSFTHQDASAMVFIQEVVLSGSATSISFSSIPQDYKDLVIVGELRSDQAVQNDLFSVRVGNGTVDSGANYRYQRAAIDDAAVATSTESEAVTSALLGSVTGASADTGIFASVHVEIFRYVDSTRRRHMQSRTSVLGNATDFYQEMGGGVWENTANAINIVTFAPSTGPNFVTGSYLTLYGRGFA